MNRPLRVLVVDDSVVFRRVVSDVISADPELQLAGTAPNGNIALQKVAQLNPDVITLDLEMPELDGIGVLRRLKATHPHIRVIVFSVHSERGAQLVATVSQLEDLVPIIRHHHERWDGTGYPGRVSGEAIPLGARVIMLADTIDAMTSDRPYRAALGEREVVAELTRMTGRQFDPHLCSAFLKSSAQTSLFEAVRRARVNAGSNAERTSPIREIVALTA